MNRIAEMGIGEEREMWAQPQGSGSRPVGRIRTPPGLSNHRQNGNTHRRGDTARSPNPDHAPFMNEYKKDFAQRRCAETCLGGIRFPSTEDEDNGCRSIWYVYILQTTILAFPFILAVTVNIIAPGVLSSDTLIIVFPSVVIAFAVSVSLYLYWRTIRVDDLFSKEGKYGEEEQSIDFDGCCGDSTLSYIYPPRESVWDPIISIILTGVLSLSAIHAMDEQRLSNVAVISSPLRTFLVVGAWLAFSLALYSLLFHTPAEPNIYSSEGSVYWARLSRAFHVLMFLFPINILHIRNSSLPALPNVVTVCLVCLCLLPVMWVAGSIPQINAFIMWAGEQLLVFGHGGSYRSSPINLILSLVLTWIVVATSYTLLEFGYELPCIIISASCGALLATNFASILYTSCSSKESRVSSIDTNNKNLGTGTKLDSSVLIQVSFVVLVATASSITGAMTGRHLNSSEISLFGPVVFLLALRLTSTALIQLQQPYIFDFFFNPLYRISRTVAKKAHKANGKIQLFDLMQNFQRLLCTLYLSHVIVSHKSSDPVSEYTPKGIDSGLFFFLWTVLTNRAMRWVWQFPLDASLELVILVCFDFAVKHNWTPYTDRERIWLPFRLALVSLLHARARVFASKLKFAATILATSWIDRKQRASFKPILHLLISALLPVWILVIFVATILDAPLVPLVGSPFFLIGFPRPKWHWPYTNPPDNSDMRNPNGSSDTMLYKHILPYVKKSLHVCFKRGTVGLVRPGDFLLIRFEDLILWVTIVESGCGYAILNAKGLELKPTSCHHTEGLRLDEVLSMVNAKPESLSCIRSFLSHALTPRCTIPITTYSSSTPSLTGIIDNRDNLDFVPVCFMRTLIWVLCSYKPQQISRDSSMRQNTDYIRSDLRHTADSPFPSEWANFCIVRTQKNSSDAVHHDLQDLKHIVLRCYNVIESSDVSFASVKTASHLYDIFTGNIPLSFSNEWIRSNARLKSKVIKAYRYAFKLAFDRMLGIGINEINDFETMEEALQELDTSWHLGNRDKEWNISILDNKENLMALSKDQNHVYTAHMLQLAENEAQIGKLNGESVRAYWSSLSHELLYLTSDDDERYSIQADSTLLRNITIQAANAPLGYFIFESTHFTVT